MSEEMQEYSALNMTYKFMCKLIFMSHFLLVSYQVYM